MKPYWLNFLRAPASDYSDAGGGGADDFDIDDEEDDEEEEEEEDDVDDDDDDEEEEDFDDDDDDDSEPRKGKAPKFDPSSLGDAIGGAIARHLPQQQQPQQKELSPEERDKLLKKFTVTDEMVEQFEQADAKGKAKVLQSIADGVAMHAITANSVLSQQFVNQLRQQFSPAAEYAREAKAKEFRGSVTKQFPALRGREQAIQMAIDHLTSIGKSEGYASPAAARKAVAHTAKQIIQRIDKTFTLKKSAKSGHPTLSRRGGGGGGGSRRGESRSRRPGDAFDF